jgi:hypothetical protein
MKICILGNSVGFRIRPPRISLGELTYSEILEHNGHNVRNVSKSAIMINEAFAFLEEDLITFFPDVVILHFGIVEASARRTFRWANNQTIINYYTNRVFSRPFNFSTVCNSARHVLFRAFNSCTRRIAALLGFQWQWLSTKRFLIVLRSMLEIIIKETNANIIVVGVTPCSDRVENILKGSRNNINEINEGMGALCKQFDARVNYLDPGCLLQEQSIDELVSDGIHFTAEGHQQLAKKLMQIIKNY